MPDTDNNTFNSLLGSRAEMADGAFSRSVTMADGSVFKVTTDNKGNDSCSCNGTDVNPHLPPESVFEAVIFDRDHFTPWCNQVTDEFSHAEWLSQQDPNANPAVLAAKTGERTETSKMIGRQFDIYQSSYDHRYMTKEQGVIDKHQKWMEDAKKLVGYQEQTETNHTAASAEDAQTGAPTIPDSSPSQR